MALPVAVWLFFLRTPVDRRTEGNKGPVVFYWSFWLPSFSLLCRCRGRLCKWVFTYTTSLDLADEATAPT
jgi:hypothetical protein